jgi:hypothetical protein
VESRKLNCFELESVWREEGRKLRGKYNGSEAKRKLDCVACDINFNTYRQQDRSKTFSSGNIINFFEM